MCIRDRYARMQLTSLSYPTPPSPNALTMLLRKYLEGAYIESIEQIQLDRIVDFTLLGTNEMRDTVKYHMYVEIMGKHLSLIHIYAISPALCPPIPSHKTTKHS